MSKFEGKWLGYMKYSLFLLNSVYINGFQFTYMLLVTISSFTGTNYLKPYFPSANFSAHRQLTEISQYYMERWCPKDSKTYMLISVGNLWAKQFAIEIDQFYEKL